MGSLRRALRMVVVPVLLSAAWADTHLLTTGPGCWELYWLYAVPPPIVEGPPTYIGPPSQPHSYYCLSARAFYPLVSRCPEPWVPVTSDSRR